METTKNSARLATREDAVVIGELLAADMRTRIKLSAPDVAEQLLPMVDSDRLAQSWLEAVTSSDGETVLVATADNEVIGFAAYMPVSAQVRAEEHARFPHPSGQQDSFPRRAEILSFTISEQHRRQGHGSRLLQALVDHAKVNVDELGVWVATSDEQRIRFFQSAGFGATPAKRDLNIGPVQDPENLWVTVIAEATTPHATAHSASVVETRDGCGCATTGSGCCQSSPK